MKFLALFKKELREAAAWMILSALVLGLWGVFVLTMISRTWVTPRVGYEPGSSLDLYRYYRHPPVEDLAGWLLVLSVGLGAVIAVRQYWVPTYTRTWAFTLHRSVPRSVVFAAKLAVAALALVLCMGGVWTLLYAMTCDPSRFPLPMSDGVYGHGWLFALAGLVAYLGTALSGLSTAKWYTTKIAGAGFATMISVFALVQYRLTVALGLLVAGAVILTVQLARALESREF